MAAMETFDFNMNGPTKKAKTTLRSDADGSPNIRSHSLYTIDEILGNSSSLRTPPQSGKFGVRRYDSTRICIGRWRETCIPHAGAFRA